MKRTFSFDSALLLAPLAGLHAKEKSAGVPRLGILRAVMFQ